MLKKGVVPLYHQLKELLTEKIEGGEWGPGHMLPAENDFVSEFRVSRATVRQALQLLANQGLIERIQGKGTFVARPKIAHNLASMFTSAADIARDGTVPSVQMHGLHRLKPRPAVRDHLGIPSGEDVYELRRSILANDHPLMLITSWLPANLFPGLEEKAFDRRTMRRVLLEDYGIDVGRQHKEVEVAILDEEEAEILKASVGMPALLVTYLSFTREGQPFEFRNMIVRGDRSKYFVDLDTPEMLV